jgi:Flp pilus assembly pilin Flp
VGGAFKRHLSVMTRNFGPARKEVNQLLNLVNLAQVAIQRLKTREEGQTIVEYGLVIGGISLVLISLFVVTGLTTVFAELIDDIKTAMDFPD